jgi:hypothetical protein
MQHLPPARERPPQAAACFPLSYLTLAGSPEAGTGDTRASEVFSSLYMDLQGKVLLREAWDRYLQDAFKDA